MLKFEVLKQCKKSRLGVLHTAHGDIRTPAFMPVGTAATVKAMTAQMVKDTGADILLCNTYHLMLRPGAERVARLGGLHKFMGWDKPILTDSGGFQVMSLGALCKLSEEGAVFSSHLDGSKHNLTPERAMEIQYLLDSNISMVLDECTKYPCEKRAAENSMLRSMRWAERCKNAFIDRAGYGTFGIVQGSMYPDLRLKSAQMLQEIGFDGYAVGGLAVGEGQQVMFETLDIVVPALSENHPRYLMGVGKPADLVGAVQRGIDMFDCVIPTRSGRFARAYTANGEINLRNARHAEDHRPLQADLDCPASQTSRAYLHHLVKADEMLGSILLTQHNLTYYQSLMQQMRAAIAAGNLDDFVAEFHERQARGDIAPLVKT